MAESLELRTEVMLLGERTAVIWTANGVRGTQDVVAKLVRTGIALDDPVTFLVAVRAAFGDDIDVRIPAPH